MVTFGRKQKKEKKLDDLRDPRAHLCTNSASFSTSLEFLTSVNLKISTLTPWLTLLLALVKSSVKQLKKNQLINLEGNLC